MDKPLGQYYKQKTNKDGHFGRCKICYNQAQKERIDKNREVYNAREREKYRKRMTTEEGRKRKRESWKKAQKQQYKKLRSTPEGVHKLKEQSIRARKQPTYLPTLRKYHAIRSKSDPEYVMKRRLRSRIRHALNGSVKSASTAELTGCTWDFLMKHIESQFVDGMSWENRSEWHIDHIRPCVTFDLLDEAEQRKCFHYSNLQPLWAADNLSKGAKYSI